MPAAAHPRRARARRSGIAMIGKAAPKDSSPKPGDKGALDRHPLVKACRREPVSYTPVWLMRQAGRYMPEYRELRARAGFLEMCSRPELAAEITTGAVRRLGVDGAIVFADILLPLLPLGVGLAYDAQGGPVIERPVRSAADFDRLGPVVVEEALGFVAEAIRLSRRALGAATPVIGFAGAPFTLASYLIEGRGSQGFRLTKTLAYSQEELWQRLMAMLAETTADYLNMQAAAGASVLQLFDSWAGALSPEDYRRLAMPYTAAVIRRLRFGVPVIHFATGAAGLLELMREAGGDVIGLDWRVDLAEAWQRLGSGVAVQGNLDPVVLLADLPEIRRQAALILRKAAGRWGHVFNLGHGVLPETPVDHVRALVDAVHEMSAR